MVRAKAAGEVGPAAQEDVITPAEGEEDCFQCHHCSSFVNEVCE